MHTHTYICIYYIIFIHFENIIKYSLEKKENGTYMEVTEISLRIGF